MNNMKQFRLLFQCLLLSNGIVHANADDGEGKDVYYDTPTGQFRSCLDICEPPGRLPHACTTFCPAYSRPHIKAESGSRKVNPVLVGTLVPIAVVIGVGGLIAAAVIIYRKRVRPVNERLKTPIQETGYTTTANDDQEPEQKLLDEVMFFDERGWTHSRYSYW